MPCCDVLGDERNRVQNRKVRGVTRIMAERPPQRRRTTRRLALRLDHAVSLP